MAHLQINIPALYICPTRGPMNNQKIYVNHIPTSYDTNALKALFATYGKITEVNYPLDRKTNKPKGYAFIAFEQPENAQKALEKNNQEIEGNLLIVEIAKEKLKMYQTKDKKQR